MLGENFYERIQKKPVFFMIYSMVAIVFISGSSFTFVIPGLYGFNGYMFVMTLVGYFFVVNIFGVLFQKRLVLVFVLSLICSTLGMGWRFWLEWGEFSLVEHTNIVVAVGYPCVLAVLMTLIYIAIEKFNPNKKLRNHPY